MIKRISTPEELAQYVFSLGDDPVEEHLECEKGEWYQFLAKVVSNPNFFIVCSHRGEKCRGYVVAIKQVTPPLLWHVTIMYAYSPGNYADNRTMVDAVKNWAKENGAKRVKFLTARPDIFGKYGFTETGKTAMETTLE